MFHGSLVALVTPMLPDQTVDIDSLMNLIDWHLEQKTDGLVILGSTGELLTLTPGEQELIISETVKRVHGRIPVIAGTGSSSTAFTIEKTRAAMELGADACLIVTPFYNKPTQEGIYQHFKAVAEAVAIPQILYNVPSRAACDLLPETLALLADCSNIVALKEATGDLSRVKRILDLCNHKIDLLSGDDASCLDSILEGGKGVISVTANVVPGQMHELCHAALQGNTEQARQIDKPLRALHQALFVESNPIPVKWALHHMGKIPNGIRLPLTPLSEAEHSKVKAAMAEANLI